MNVLAVGAHPDDIEHGCGGTLRKLGYLPSNNSFMLVMTDGANNGHVDVRREESRKAADVLSANLFMLGEPDGHLQVERRVIQKVEKCISSNQIDTVFVHAPPDSHQTIAQQRKLSWRRLVIFRISCSSKARARSTFSQLSLSRLGHGSRTNR